MEVKQAQADMRRAFVGGATGQFVSGVLWLASAAFMSFGEVRTGVLVLVVGGFFIFPLTQLVLRALGHPGRAAPGNPLNALGMQVAFVVPLCLPLVGAAALHELNWFYPAFMIVVGAHYLPFVTLYGMRVYAGLAAVLVSSGLMLGLYLRSSLAFGGWLTGAVLVAFSVLGRRIAIAER